MSRFVGGGRFGRYRGESGLEEGGSGGNGEQGFGVGGRTVGRWGCNWRVDSEAAVEARVPGDGEGWGGGEPAGEG